MRPAQPPFTEAKAHHKAREKRSLASTITTDQHDFGTVVNVLTILADLRASIIAMREEGPNPTPNPNPNRGTGSAMRPARLGLGDAAGAERRPEGTERRVPRKGRGNAARAYARAK